jgi:hypothetical protein
VRSGHRTAPAVNESFVWPFTALEYETNTYNAYWYNSSFNRALAIAKTSTPINGKEFIPPGMHKGGQVFRSPVMQPHIIRPSCKNKIVGCNHLQTAGRCENSEWFMRMHCARSCGFCDNVKVGAVTGNSQTETTKFKFITMLREPAARAISGRCAFAILTCVSTIRIEGLVADVCLMIFATDVDQLQRYLQHECFGVWPL